jgi:hypothetical protein
MVRSMKIKNLIAITAVLSLGISAQAVTLNYTFLENGTGTLGSSSTFTEGGYSIIATGVNDTLYGKNAGAGENGLGMTTDTDHEITSAAWVQLDVSQLVGSSLATIFLSSVQSGETAKIWASNANGSLGSLISTIAADGSLDITSYLASYRYIDVTAGSGNVLVAALTANAPSRVPDGGTTVAMLGSALAALGLIRRKLA